MTEYTQIIKDLENCSKGAPCADCQQPKAWNCDWMLMERAKAAIIELVGIHGNVIEGAKAIPVPPHGRLIDADALIELCRGHNSQRTMWSEIEYLLDNAPTIIEAEEGE